MLSPVAKKPKSKSAAARAAIVPPAWGTTTTTGITADERDDDHSGTPLRTTATQVYGFMFNNVSSSREERGRGGLEDSNNSNRGEKIRRKNQRNHQRRKEKAALYVHEQCLDCLRARKLQTGLEELAEFGFPPGRAKKALMLNKGSLGKFYVWLKKCDGESEQQDMPDDDANLDDVDITKELQWIADVVSELPCTTKQEVEKLVVDSRGNLEEASERLRYRKGKSSVLAPPKVEELEEDQQASPPEGKLVAVTPTVKELVDLKGNSMTADQRSSISSKGKGCLQVSEEHHHPLRTEAVPPTSSSSTHQQNRGGGSDLVGSVLPVSSSSMRNVPLAWRRKYPLQNLHFATKY